MEPASLLRRDVGELDHLAHVRRQLKLENRAFVDSRRHQNTIFVPFDNRMADGKANSHTTVFGREHRVENMIVVGWIDTRASILDGHVNKIWFANAGFVCSIFAALPTASPQWRS